MEIYWGNEVEDVSAKEISLEINLLEVFTSLRLVSALPVCLKRDQT